MHKRDRTDRERGAGVFSMAIGLMMFLIMLVFAVNLLYNLYTTSVISSLALEAARDAAEMGGSTADAANDFRAEVDGATTFTLNRQGPNIVATIRWESRSLFPAFTDARAFGVIDRTFTVRVEEQQVP